MSFRQIPEIDSFFPKSQIAENDSVMFFYRRPSRKTTNYSTKRSERSYMQKIVVRDTFFHNKNSVSVDIAKARESFLMRKKLRTISQDANNPNFQKLKTKKSKVLSKTLLIEKKSTIIRKEKDSTFLSAKPKPLELNLNVFPNWLTERLDFQTSLQTSESPIDISKVASIFPAYYRSDTMNMPSLKRNFYISLLQINTLFPYYSAHQFKASKITKFILTKSVKVYQQ